MGTPDFSASHLQALVKAEYNVVGVFSQPDKVSGRGAALRPTPVKKMAMKYDIPIFQPRSVNLKKGFEQLVDLEPDVIIVVAFGKILKKKVIDLPAQGIYNVHASLLPKYRGAAPIQRAIENGESETGITIMKITEELDAGDMALQKSVPIETTDNLEQVYDKLEKAGKQLLIEFLEKLAASDVHFKEQDHEKATYASKIEKEDLIVDWNLDAEAVHNKIRAFDPIPCARTFLNKKSVKIKSSVGFFDNESHEAPGTILSIDKTGALIKCGKGSVLMKEIQLPSKKFTSFFEAKNGRKIDEGERFKCLR
jgi:methionyl-tRNA formyltransferase